MKTIILLLITLCITQVTEAQKLIAKNGHVWFFSHTPMEDIEAHNTQVASIIDKDAGTVQFSLLIKSFEFKKKLMQEHFNENYMESNVYPKATFSGNLLNFENIDLSKPGTYDVEVAGDLTIHGVIKKVTIPGKLVVSEKSVQAKSKFNVKTADYNIRIPDVVKDNIAENIEVNVDITYNVN